jgi:hypothetical protein
MTEQKEENNKESLYWGSLSDIHSDNPLEIDSLEKNTSEVLKPNTIPEKQESARRLIASWLLLLLSVEIIFLGAGACLGYFPIELTKDISAIILTPTIAMTSTAIGFYFGSKN